MTESEAIRLAAEQGCDMSYSDERSVWQINKISHESDMVELSRDKLAILSAAEFVADYMPELL